MAKTMQHPRTFNVKVKVRTFPKPDSIRVLTFQHAETLQRFRLRAMRISSPRGPPNIFLEN